MMRTDWVTYGFRLCSVIRMQSTCVRRKVSCVVFHRNRPIATGFNGVRSGEPHPQTLADCVRHRNGILPGQQPNTACCIHAEQNASDLVRNTPWMGADLWAVSWTEPCEACCIALASVGVTKVYYHEPYPKQDRAKLPVGFSLIHHPYNEVLIIEAGK